MPPKKPRPKPSLRLVAMLYFLLGACALHSVHTLAQKTPVQADSASATRIGLAPASSAPTLPS